MRRWRGLGAGCMVAAGVVILVTLALPAVCWWFLIGLALVVGGMSLRRGKVR